jgi:hypothetical protein
LSVTWVGADRDEVWERSLAILGSGSSNLSNPAGVPVTLRPDASGLPFVAAANKIEVEATFCKTGSKGLSQ